MQEDPLFLQARGNHEDGLLVGEPHFNKTLGRWQLPLAHRVEDHAGRFQGIVIGHLDLTHFDRMIDRRHLSPADSLALRSTQLTLLSRQTGRDEQIQPIGTRRTAPAFAEALKAAPLSGEFTARNVFDGVERLTAYSTAAPFPVMAVAGVSREEVLRPWVAVAWRIGALAGMAALAVLASAALTLRAWRLQSRSAQRAAHRRGRSAHPGAAGRRRRWGACAGPRWPAGGDERHLRRDAGLVA